MELIMKHGHLIQNSILKDFAIFFTISKKKTKTKSFDKNYDYKLHQIVMKIVSELVALNIFKDQFNSAINYIL